MSGPSLIDRLVPRSPRDVSLILMVVAFALALGTVTAIGNQQLTLPHGMVLALAAILFTLSSPSGLSPTTETLHRPAIAGVPRLPVGVAFVVAGCAAAAAAGYIGYGSFDALFYSGLLAYAVGFALIGLGLAIAADWRPRRALTRWRDAVRGHPREALALTLVLLLGLIFRLYQLDYYPPPDGFALVDEPQIGAAATHFMRYGGHPWTYPELVYAAVLCFKLFGASMLTLRYPNVLAGFLLLPVFYAFARQFFSPPAALAGTALLAVSRWEIAYTRLVLPSCTMMLAELIVFLLAVRAVRGGATYAGYALMGVLLGAGLYSHVSFRLVPIILLLWTVGFLVVEHHRLRDIVRWHAPGGLLLAVLAVAVALPYAGLIRQEGPAAFSERFTSIMPLLFNPSGASGSTSALSDHVQSLLGYVVGPGDGWPAVNVPNAPMLDPITATLVLLGLGYGLLHLRRPSILMIVSWLALTLVTGAILTVDFRPERFIACLPPIFLLACLPLEVVIRRVRDLRSHRFISLSIAIILLALFGVAGWINANALYNVQSHNLIARNTFAPPAVDTVEYFRGKGNDGLNYLFADFPFPDANSDWGWMAGDPAGRNPADLADALPVHEPVTGPLMHVMIAQPYPLAEVAHAFQGVYPGATLRLWTNEATGNSYSAVTVDAAEIARRQGLNGPCPRPTLCGRRIAATSGRAQTSYWTGSLYVPADGQYTLQAAGPSGMKDTVRLEGVLASGQLTLHVGWYSLSIKTRGDSAAVIRPSLQWTGPNVAGVIPTSNLRNTPAHGLLERFLTPDASSRDLVPPERVPFPFFLFTFGHNSGRPWLPQRGFPFRATLTGVVAAGHAGLYRMILYGVGGDAAVLLDHKKVASAANPLSMPDTETPFTLRLDSRPHALQLQFSTTSTQDQQNSGAAIFVVTPTGERTFLPWDWITPL